MTHRTDLEAAALASPDDDDAHLVLADWLEEQGDLGRADLIRQQCQLARLRPWDRGWLEARWALDVLADHGARLLGELPALDGVEWTELERGFPATVRVRDLATLYRHAAAIAAAAPVHRVEVAGELTDWVPELRDDDDDDDDDDDEERGTLLEPPVAGLPWMRTLRVTNFAYEPRFHPERPVHAMPPVLELASMTTDDRLAWLSDRPASAPLRVLRMTGQHVAGRGLAEQLAAMPAAKSLVALEVGTDFEDHDSGYFDDPTMREAGARAIAAAGLDQLVELDIDHQRIGSAGLAALVSSLPALRMLSVRANEITDVAALATSTGAPLVHLDLSSNELGDAGARAIAAGPRLAQLESLLLDTCEITAAGVRALAASPAWSQVRVLVLDGNPLGVEAMLALVEASAPAQLHTLRLAHADLGRDAIALLAELPWLRSVVWLELAHDPIGDGLGPLATALAGGALRKLGLAHAMLRPEAGPILAPLWPQLIDLDLGFNPLGNAGVDALVTAEPSALQTLSLAGCGLTGESIASLSRARCPRLRSLSLANNELVAGAIRALLRSPLLANLDVLDLARCSLSDPIAELLANAPALARLSKLRLRGNTFSEASLLALARSPYLASIPSIELTAEPWDFEDETRALLAERFGTRWHHDPDTEVV